MKPWVSQYQPGGMPRGGVSHCHRDAIIVGKEFGRGKPVTRVAHATPDHRYGAGTANDVMAPFKDSRQHLRVRGFPTSPRMRSSRNLDRVSIPSSPSAINERRKPTTAPPQAPRQNLDRRAERTYDVTRLLHSVPELNPVVANLGLYQKWLDFLGETLVSHEAHVFA